MEVSGQLHALAVLPPRKESPVPNKIICAVNKIFSVRPTFPNASAHQIPV
jgi:hypothetical protein